VRVFSEDAEMPVVRDLNVVLALLGGLTLLLSLATGVIRSRVYFPTEPIAATLFGVLVGPVGLDLLRLSAWGDPMVVMEEVTRLAVALAVTSIALRLPENYFRERAGSMAALVGPGMVVMWLASSLVVLLVLGLPTWVALLVGAAVTPTDPVLANSIVVGGTAEENIPTRLRYLVSGEAGANDGAAYPLVFLAVLVLAHPDGAALTEWMTRTVLWAGVGAVGLGLVVGGTIGRVEEWASRRDFLDEASVFTVTIALTFAVVGIGKLIGVDDILAVFVAGLAYNWQADPRDEADQQQVEEVVNRLFTIPVFVLFGTVVPWSDWAALGWRGLALVAGILAFRRLPMVVALRRFVPPLDHPEATAFVGWFGPIGVAALFYATLAVRETGIEVVWPVVSLVVAGSILAHGVTATPITVWYGGREEDTGTW
jgi:NhaP-type Na+/H+ or K+/H+ antiporter